MAVPRCGRKDTQYDQFHGLEGNSTDQKEFWTLRSTKIRFRFMDSFCQKLFSSICTVCWWPMGKETLCNLSDKKKMATALSAYCVASMYAFIYKYIYMVYWESSPNPTNPCDLYLTRRESLASVPGLCLRLRASLLPLTVPPVASYSSSKTVAPESTHRCFTAIVRSSDQKPCFNILAGAINIA